MQEAAVGAYTVAHKKARLTTSLASLILGKKDKAKGVSVFLTGTFLALKAFDVKGSFGTGRAVSMPCAHVYVRVYPQPTPALGPVFAIVISQKTN